MAGGTQGAGSANFKVPDEMRDMAERSVVQTRQALDSFIQAAKRTTDSMEQTTGKVQADAKGMAQKTLSTVEQTLHSTLDYAERLVRAKDMQEVMQIQSEFAKAQTEALQTHMKEYGSAVQSAMETAKGVAQTAVESVKDVAQTAATVATQAKDRIVEAAAGSRDKTADN